MVYLFHEQQQNIFNDIAKSKKYEFAGNLDVEINLSTSGKQIKTPSCQIGFVYNINRTINCYIQRIDLNLGYVV